MKRNKIKTTPNKQSYQTKTRGKFEIRKIVSRKAFAAVNVV